MKRLVTALIAAALVTAAPALAKDFIQDQAGMFGPGTVQRLNTRLSNFNAQTGKEVIVQTVPSVSGGDVQQAAQNAFSQQRVNGVLIFIDKGDRKDWIMADRAAVQAGWWTAQTSATIARSMEAQFRAGDFDGGITTAVDGVLNVYRSHLSSLNNVGAQQYGAARGRYVRQQSQGVHISVFWWIIIALFAFFIIRSIARAASGPRNYGGGPGYGPGPGYGYGGGYGGYGWGGGGGFFSGLLGGLGGAWLGNELFGNQNVGTGAWGNVDPTGGAQPPADAGGWQSDPGQAGMGGGGDWGGGGFGGGDFGGGFGGGDFGGGGGGDAGGGW